MGILCAKWVDCFIEYVFFVYDATHNTSERGSKRAWIMQEFVHDIYCRYIDENLSGHEVDEWRVQYELKYKK